MPPLPDIRPVAPQDLEALTDMVRHLARFHGDTPSVTSATLARDCLGQAPWLRVLVADRGGALCGYAALCPRARLQFGERGMDLHHLYVQKDLRGCGVGRRLIEAACDLARDLGADSVSVGTRADNAAAQQLYLSTAFQSVTGDGPRFRRRLA